jgi:hypothetical protein
MASDSCKEKPYPAPSTLRRATADGNHTWLKGDRRYEQLEWISTDISRDSLYDADIVAASNDYRFLQYIDRILTDHSPLN